MNIFKKLYNKYIIKINIKQSMKEVKLYKQGKLKLKTWEELLKEL